MYDELLRIKRYREDRALQGVRRQQHLLDQQARLTQDARDEVARFRDWRVDEETRLFEEVRNRQVRLLTIETMNLEVAALREREALLETRVLEEEKRLTAAREALDEARRRHAASVREREKFDQFVEIQKAIENRDQMMREENELEEIASAGHQARREGAWS